MKSLKKELWYDVGFDEKSANINWYFSNLVRDYLNTVECRYLVYDFIMGKLIESNFNEII
jgi:hypothetical protein